MGHGVDDAPAGSPPASRRGRLFLRIVLICAVIGCELLALVGLLLHVTSVTSRPAVLLTSFAVYLMFFAPLGLVLALSARRWGLAVVPVILTVLVGLVVTPRFVGSGPAAAGPTLRVMQFNQHSGASDAPEIVRTVAARRVDVLSLEEMSADRMAALHAAGIDRALPFHYYDTTGNRHADGSALWSRYPLTGGRVELGFDSGAVTAVVAVPGAAPVTLIGVHVSSPATSTAARWHDDLSHLGRLMTASPGAVIVLGDLNSTLDHEPMRRLLRAGFGDAADEAGAGLLGSYPAGRSYPPLIAIDHVLVRGGRARSVATVSLPGAEHRALLANLQLIR